MGLESAFNEGIMMKEATERNVQSFYDNLKGYDASTLIKLKKEISPHGFWAMVKFYLFSELPYEMDAIDSLLEERGIKN